MTPLGKHRILVCGGGSIGTRHTRNLQTLGAEDITVYEPDALQRSRLERELGVRTATSYEEVLSTLQPTIVLICSPTAYHIPQALMAVRAGAHVFIEKPLSHSKKDVNELAQVSAKKKKIAMVGCNMRFHPGPVAIKKLLEAGTIGEPIAARIFTGSYLPHWHPRQDYHQSYSASSEQGGAALDCIHEIDLALWYFGPAMVVGSAVLPATTIGLQTDGLAEILLTHNTGTLSSVHLNFIEREYRRFCHVIGTAGSLEWDFSRGSVLRFNGDGKLAETREQPKDWKANDMYLEELQHFFHAVETGLPPFSTILEAEQALSIALAVRSTR